MHMQRFVLDSHFTRTKEVAGLERQARKNSEEIKSTQEIVRRDMQALQDQIGELRTLVKDQKEQTSMLAPRRSRTERHVSVSEEFPENFSKDRIAEVYLEEAEDYEKAAAKLREQAENMCSGITRKLVTMKMLDTPSGVNGGTKTQAQFVCCRSTFTSVQEMLEHVDVAHAPRMDLKHAENEERSLVLDGSGDGTPTHVPPRRQAKVERDNHAVEIKAPVEVDEKTPTEVSGQREHEADVVGKAHGTRTGIETRHVISADSDATVGPAPVVQKKWQPLAVRQMSPPPTLSITRTNTETFTWEFLKLTLGGEQWSPGFYFISKDSILPSKAYWILDADTEPYLPSIPGEHGAKLTAFFNNTIPNEEGTAPDEENYLETPVFIRPEGQKEYIYFGSYSQLRFSDKLDYDRVLDTVPEQIRLYWAEQLAAAGRPEWVTKALMEHFWPKPVYEGPVPTDDEETTEGQESEGLEKRISQAQGDYALELRDWEKEARMKVRLLTAQNLMAAFRKADADEEAGLRLWWEYLQCVGYDQGFYEMLVAIKGDGKVRVPVRRAGVDKVASQVSGKTVKATAGVHTVGLQAAVVKQDSPAATRKGEKNHTLLTKPWEHAPAAEESRQEEKKAVVNGDMDVAKRLQEDFKNGGRSSHKNGDRVKGAYLAPHLRAKAARI